MEVRTSYYSGTFFEPPPAEEEKGKSEEYLPPFLPVPRTGCLLLKSYEGNARCDNYWKNAYFMREVHLSDFRGKTVLLFFWAISCSSCVKELPVIQRFSAQQQAAGKQLVILAVDIDDVSGFVRVVALQNRLGLTFQILVDDHYQARSSYQITDVPGTYFIDRQHFIRSPVPGPLDETRLLKEAGRVE